MSLAEGRVKDALVLSRLAFGSSQDVPVRLDRGPVRNCAAAERRTDEPRNEKHTLENHRPSKPMYRPWQSRQARIDQLPQHEGRNLE